MGIPPCGQTDGQTRVKTLPSRRTTYAGGNYYTEIDKLTVVGVVGVALVECEHGITHNPPKTSATCRQQNTTQKYQFEVPFTPSVSVNAAMKPVVLIEINGVV